MAQASTPLRGELLAGRYQLEDLIRENGDTGHSVWRGIDELLNRAVSIELQVPGGEGAECMLDNAAAAGRIRHSSVAGVYDAVDEGERAFVVREWVQGRTLTEVLLTEGPFDPYRAAALARTVADAIAAIHATGATHGKLDPNTVLLNEDGEPTFVDLDLDTETPPFDDLRAIGGLLYATLTGSWPLEAAAGFTDLPDAVRTDGRLCSPRQIRAGIPAYLDTLAMELLDPNVGNADAAALASELRRYDITDPNLDPLPTETVEPAPGRPPWRRFGIPIAAVACIIAAGLAVGAVGLPDISGSNYPLSSDPTSDKDGDPLRPAAVSILDPQGDGTELVGAQNAIDRNKSTAWKPDSYRRPNFGGLKTGMGVVVDLGKPTRVEKVTVSLSTPGTSLELRGAATKGESIDSYQPLGGPMSNAPTEVTFELDRPENYRYLVVWITEMPRSGSGSNPYTVGVREVSVYG